MDIPKDPESSSVTELLRSRFTTEEIQAGKIYLSACFQVSARALLFILNRATLKSLGVTSKVSMLPRGNELKPAVRLDCFLDARFPQRECVCGAYVPALSTEESLESYREQNPFSRPVVINPECAECARYSIAHLAIHFAAPSAKEIWSSGVPFALEFQSKGSFVDRWFAEYSALESIKTTLLDHAKALSMKIVLRERKSISELTSKLALADPQLNGEEAELILRRHLVSPEPLF